MSQVQQLGRVSSARADVAAAGPIAAIDALLAKKPNARIAIVQGSFDWFHSGHLALVENVAAGRLTDPQNKRQEPFDLVVVIPTREYERKPYLRNSFERRLELARAAIDGVPTLRGKVAVSDAMTTLPNRPTDLMQSLVGTYPGARFAYCLGADSFNDSANHQRWPNFDWVEKNVALVAVPRGGYGIEQDGRARAKLDGKTVTISSTEIRNAIYNNDITPLIGRVPATTLAAIREAASARESDRRAGARLIGIDKPSEQSFAALQKSRPKNAVDLLAMLDETELSETVREHLATVQQRINDGANERRLLDFSVSKQQMSKESGFADKLVLDARSGTHLSGRYLYKPMAQETAAKVEFVSILANLVGMPTPLVQTQDLAHDKTAATGGRGVSIKLIDDVLSAHPRELDYDYGKAEPKVLEYLVLSRWLNQVVGNLDCWGAQFLVPRGEKNRYREIVNIDLDEAFNKMPQATLHDALTNHFGIKGVAPKDCVWRDEDYVFARPVGEAALHYDSQYTMYGPMWQAYMQGKCDLDIAAIKQKLAFVQELPPAAVLNAMRKYLDNAGVGTDDTGMVTLPAAPGGKIAKADFERLFVERLYASVEQFGGFLDQMKAARDNPSDPRHQRYAELAPRAY